MKKFKKYLLCILLCILAVNFLVNVKSVVSNNSAYLFASKVAKNPKSEELIEIGKSMEESLEKNVDDIKNKNGEDYPALGILYLETVQHHSSVLVIQNFIFSLIAGFALGNIIFVVFVSELQSYKLVISLILILFVTSIFLTLSDIYTYIANNEEVKFGLSQIFWNMEASSIFYSITCIITIVINKIHKTYHEIRYS